MITHLLDTNIISSFVRDPNNVVSRGIEAVGVGAVAINPIICGELLFGVEKKRDARLAARISAVIAPIMVLGIEQVAAAEYARLRVALERRGTPIGANDMWIAAHALALDLTLVTDNEREFARVEGLRVENWLRA